MVRTDIGASLADRLENRWGHDVDSDDLDQVLDKLGAGILDQSLQQEALTSLADYCSVAFATYSTVCHETRLNSCFYSSHPDGRFKIEQPSAMRETLVELAVADREAPIEGQMKGVILAPEEGNHPAFERLLELTGMAHLMGSVALRHNTKTTFLFLLNDEARGQFTVQDIERFNNVQVASRGLFRMLQQMDDRLANHVLQTISPIFAAVIVNAKGQHVSHNERFQELLDDGVLRTTANDYIEFGDTSSETLMSNLQTGKISQKNQIPLLFSRGEDFFKIGLLELPTAGFQSPDDCLTAIVLSPVSREPKLNIELARQVYNFTPSEAEIAAELIAGRSTKFIAESRGVAPSTVKSLVRGVLRKTETARQIEAVARLNTLPQNFSTLEN